MREFLVYVMWWLSAAIQQKEAAPKRPVRLGWHGPEHRRYGCDGLWVESITRDELFCESCKAVVWHTPENVKWSRHLNAVGAGLEEIVRDLGRAA